MIFKRGRYSGFLRPISYALDLLIIGLVANQLNLEKSTLLNFILFISFSWIVSSLSTRFYEIYRFTSVTRIFTLVGKQSVLFVLLVYSFFGFHREIKLNPKFIVEYILIVVFLITILKISIYILLKKYRTIFNGNLRKVVIIGLNKKTDQLRKYFNDNPDYGYKLIKIFNLKDNINIDSITEYISENEIDEIYSSVTEINNQELVKLIDYADNNLKIFKIFT